MQPVSPATFAERLTRREIEVANEIASGMSTKQIAKSLGIHFKTVVSHRTNIMKKLRVPNAAALVRVAIREGYIQS